MGHGSGPSRYHYQMPDLQRNSIARISKQHAGTKIRPPVSLTGMLQD
jgi:hypothetical protein